MTELDDPQHLDPGSVEEYFRLGVRTAFDLNDDPSVRLVIDPPRRELQLLTPVSGSEPEVTAYERIDVRRVRPEGASEDWYELSVDASDMHYEAYVLAESVADQLRAGASFRHAVSESLESLKDLLASRKRLTEERVAGLIGELFVLERIIASDGEDAAIAAWLGPLAEEHDFGLPGFDAEVKTTKSESRVHVVGSDTQLEPVPGRPLYLVRFRSPVRALRRADSRFQTSSHRLAADSVGTDARSTPRSKAWAGATPMPISTRRGSSFDRFRARTSSMRTSRRSLPPDWNQWYPNDRSSSGFRTGSTSPT